MTAPNVWRSLASSSRTLASSSSISSSSSRVAFFATALPRQSQHERTESPARQHRRGQPMQDRDPYTSAPSPSSPTEPTDDTPRENTMAALSSLAEGFSSQSMPDAPLPGNNIPGPEAVPGGMMQQAESSSVPPNVPQYPQLAHYERAALPSRTDESLETFVKLLMRDGKKATATKHTTDMLQALSITLNTDPLPAFVRAVELVAPMCKVVTQTQRAKNVRIPMSLTFVQSRRAAMEGIIRASGAREPSKNQRDVGLKLARQVLEILNGTSTLLVKKEEIHREATKNRSNLAVRT